MSRIFCLVILPLLLVSCSKEQRGQSASPGVPVITTRAVQMDVPVEIHAIGTVQPYSEVAVRPQITGPVVEVFFSEGQEVKSGDLLFTLDPRSFDAELKEAEANLRRDEAQMISARLNFLRTSNLFASTIASEQDYETAEAAFRAAEATVFASAAAVTNAAVSLSYTTIRAPVGGRTGNLSVKAGNVVKAFDDVLVTITQVRPIYVAFSVPEQHLPAIRLRVAEAELPIRAFIPGDTNNAATGELTFINNRVDTNTGTIHLKGTFANEENLLWPGQFVEATLTLNELKQATTVPAQAVQSSQSGEIVFVVKDDRKVETRSVNAGLLYDGLRVIVSGVNPGETVVVDGQLALTNGAIANVKSAEEAGLTISTGQP